MPGNPPRSLIPSLRRTEVEVAASAGAAILASGLLPKTPENVVRVARIIGIEPRDIRSAWWKYGHRGYPAPNHIPVVGDEAVAVVEPTEEQPTAPVKKPKPVRPPATKVVRDWARQQGYTIGVKGKVPLAVLEAYIEAHQ